MGENPLFDKLSTKASLKSDVYRITNQVFKEFKAIIREVVDEFQQYQLEHENASNVIVQYRDRGAFEIELKFGGDVLIFMMHTNVFEFSRFHQVMKTSYIKEDIERSFCGVINIYNFLSDSFKYKRLNDSGYMIGRVFINKDEHYFIEGKKEIGLLYTNFNTSIMNKEAARKIIEAAIMYTINFDLLTPPYEQVQEVSVHEFQATLDNMKLRTGKRLGFKFQADADGIKEQE